MSLYEKINLADRASRPARSCDGFEVFSFNILYFVITAISGKMKCVRIGFYSNYTLRTFTAEFHNFFLSACKFFRKSKDSWYMRMVQNTKFKVRYEKTHVSHSLIPFMKSIKVITFYPAQLLDAIMRNFLYIVQKVYQLKFSSQGRTTIKGRGEWSDYEHTVKGQRSIFFCLCVYVF